MPLEVALLNMDGSGQAVTEGVEFFACRYGFTKLARAFRALSRIMQPRA